jgi:hypothetical protein
MVAEVCKNKQIYVIVTFLYLLKSRKMLVYVNTTYVQVGDGSGAGAGAERNIFGSATLQLLRY